MPEGQGLIGPAFGISYVAGAKAMAAPGANQYFAINAGFLESIGSLLHNYVGSYWIIPANYRIGKILPTV